MPDSCANYETLIVYNSGIFCLSPPVQLFYIAVKHSSCSEFPLPAQISTIFFFKFHSLRHCIESPIPLNHFDQPQLCC